MRCCWQSFAKKVYLVHRRDTLRASRVYLEPLKSSGVEFISNSRCGGPCARKKLTGVELEDVRTGERRTPACEGLFVAIGRVPDTGLLRGQVELDAQGM